MGYLNVHIHQATQTLAYPVLKMANLKRTGIDRKGAVSFEDLVDLAKKNPDAKKAGAIVTFTGIVRGYTHEGKEVEKLEMQAYDELAEKALEKISAELRAKKGIADVIVHHLVGSFGVGEDLVYVVVLADSRRNAFSTAQEAVERYKKEVAVWKKEYLRNGSSYWAKE